MRIRREGSIDVAELDVDELASLDARIHSLDHGKTRTYSDAELDETWRIEDQKVDLD